MKAELDELLCERYPKIFADRHKPKNKTAMCWGFMCGDGWFDLIDSLCAKLQALSDQEGSIQIVATQVKEKFGCLSFYVRSSTDEQHEEIVRAMEMSTRICEECGQPGRIVVNNGWHITRCPMHTPASTIYKEG
jgi:hypothetical protein